ncbi:uncharacterized protein LOC117169476 [Belonocnema kinseyi]|uniref:uncharacterized protein LOC117169476 n=1 Tax=Belonocnema kinseyi TaxID=2817044 RepID=UPI00143D2929|nr:uncharacterized protein LOC117169476 [Belonocnema kinseyi]
MLNSNSAESEVADGSCETSQGKQSSKFSRLNGKYFSFPSKSRKDVSLKNEENLESIEKIRSGDGRDEIPSGRSPGFFKNIKKRLQIRKLVPSRSKQKVKSSEPNNEISRRDDSLKSVSAEIDPIESRGQLETPEVRSSSNPVSSYIAALMFNGENDERVPRFSELIASQSFNAAASGNLQEAGESAAKNLNLEANGEGKSCTNFELNEENENGLRKQAHENNNEEYQYDVLAGGAESMESPIYGDLNKDNFEGKNGTKATLTEELLKLSKYGWYWGPISGEEADSKLISESDGAFLVRDSSDDRYLLTLSFKSSGKLLHARMEHSGGLFSLCNHSENHGYTSVADLIDHSMSCSQSAVFCYSRPRHPGHPSFPVRLTKPVSRFTQVRSLQYLCRFVIRQNTRLDNIHKLPLPKPIRGYIEEAHY